MASIARRFDFQLDSKGYMLVRGEYKGRAWNRTGASDSPSRRSSTDAKYGELPDELDHPEVWDDWSGGYGLAYRRNGENMYHWAENFDARNPRQLIHAQLPTVVRSGVSNNDRNIQQLMALPPQVNASQWLPYQRQPLVLIRAKRGVGHAVPDPVGSVGIVAIDGRASGNDGRGVLTASGVICPYLDYSGNPVVELRSPFGSLVATYNLPYLHLVNASDRTYIVIGGSGNFRPAVRSIVGDPLATVNLTASLLVGTDLSVVSDVATIWDQLAVGTNDGLWLGDQSGTFVNVIPSSQQSASNENCRDLMPWGNGLLAPTVDGLWYYQSSGFEALMNQVNIPVTRSPVIGYIRSLGRCGPWVYGGLWTGSGSFLIASNDIGERRPQWHTLQRFPGMEIQRIFFDGITTASGSATINIPQRAYIAMGGDHVATSPLYAWPIPYADGNPLAPQLNFSANYIGSARIDLGNVDWNSPSTPKSFRSIEIWADTLLSGYRYADVYYDVDQSGSFTLLGRANTSPVSTIFFPAGEGSFVSGQSIELSLRSFTASPALTPVYRSIVLRGALRPNSIDQITAVVRIADGVRDRQGGSMRNGATMLKELRDLAAQDTPTTLIDLTGAVSYVNVLPPVQESEYYQKGEDNPEVAATVKMSVMVFS